MKDTKDKDISSLTDEELLEYILQYSCKDDEVAQSTFAMLRKHIPTIHSLLTTPESVLQTWYIPERRCIEYIRLLREYAIRAVTPPYKTLLNEQTIKEFAHMALMKIGYVTTEVILGILFTHDKRFITIENMALGSANTAIFDIRTVIDAIERHHANAVILVHNHPSGSPLPSAEDRKTTDIIAQACDVCGYCVLDHYIVTHQTVYSMYTDSYIIRIV